ncbi:MAG: extracellular solute-binding protein [Firmicutes bacterium]|nr:extracellular solute-binding protein [Bacillota bacterium]
MVQLLKRKSFLTGLIAVLVLGLVLAGCGQKQEETGGEIMLATTTSTYDTGLLDYLNEAFTEKTGIEVKVTPKGTGQALELGKRGDADVLLVHDRASELQLVEEGYFVDRQDVMYNDFIILGPAADPAGIKGMKDAVEALKAIAEKGSTFVSRGDDSGTHRLELRLWEQAGVEVEGKEWYNAVGQGMGDTLRVAHEKEAYVISDRGTYLSLKDDLELEILVEGDPVLFNQYGVMAVNPERHEHVKYDLAKKYIDFLMSEEGQERIASFKVKGEQLFFPGLGIQE